MKKEKMRNYRCIFQDGSEISFNAAGLKEAENVIKDYKKSPEELIELHSEPQPEPKCPCHTTYTLEEVNKRIGVFVANDKENLVKIKIVALFPELDEAAITSAKNVAEKVGLSIEIEPVVIDEEEGNLIHVNFVVNNGTDICKNLAEAQSFYQGFSEFLEVSKALRTICQK